jgi:predicted Zn finger-like uncharacterized protein
MPITLNCPKCHKPFRVRDESIGGRVRCPSCGSVLQVPSALSPASNFGDEPKAEAGVGAAPRPVAEDVPPGGSRAGALNELMLGGAARRDEAVDLSLAAGPSAGPPSIRGHMPSAPAASARASAPPPPPPPQPPAAPARPPIRLPVSSGDPGWRRVYSGLGMIRWAMFLCALVFVGAFAHAGWCVYDAEGALKDGPGFLGKADWPRWKEVLMAYTVGPLVPAALLLLLGRLRCSGAPSAAHARGLAAGAAFFTLIGLAGLALYIGMTYFDLADKLGDKVKIPPVARPIAIIAALPSAILADVLTLFFIGQIGWPLGRPHLQRAAAGVFVYAAVLPAGILIGHLFYPAYDAALESWHQSGSPLGAGDDTELARRVMIWAAIILGGALMFFLRYAGVAGAGRRAIRKFLAGEVA